MSIIRIVLITIFFVPLIGAWPFFFSSEKPVPLIGKQSDSIIMINPAGDPRTPGREIDDTFERALTMQCAQALKNYLEKKVPKIRVVITRRPGEAVEPLQNATFSNRLGTDLYINLNFFKQNKKAPEIFIYTLMFDPVTDFVEKKGSELSLLPYDQSYKVSLNKTKEIAQSMFKSFTQAAQRVSLVSHKPISLPSKPLLGITAPAISIEIGIHSKSSWKELVPVIGQAIEEIVT